VTAVPAATSDEFCDVCEPAVGDDATAPDAPTSNPIGAATAARTETTERRRMFISLPGLH